MNGYILILVIVAIVATLTLVTLIILNKLKEYKERYTIAEKNIEENLDKKLDIITIINNEINKNNKGKNYLEEYVSVKDLIITNIEKDIKLNEAEELINKLLLDNSKMNTAKVKKQLVSLRLVDEKITSYKNIYNKNALLNNNFIKKFPHNIISKVFGYKIKNYYVNNKTDDEDNL